MKKFYELYSDPILPQFVEELKSKEDSINVPQLVGDLSDKELFSIPWGHHRASMPTTEEIENELR